MPLLKILVVEDYAPFRSLTCAALQRADFQTIEAVDGLEAVQKAEELQPDLILLDINLPKLHGFEVAARSLRLVPHVRLLFMSQESSPDIVRKALSLGADGYIHKVSAATDLLSAIDTVLAGHRFVSRSVELTEPIDAPAPCRHEILFCADDAAVVDGLTRHIAAALSAADAAIVLATEAHRTHLVQEMRTRGVDLDGAIARGTCLLVDADVAPDPARIVEAINGVRAAAVRAGKARPRVAFFGERAGRLWAAGRTAEAIQLEEFCGELALDADILCAYPVPYTDDDQALARVCAEHTAVSASPPPRREARETAREPGALAVAAAITTLERTEKIRSHYAAIVEFSDDAIITKDLDGVISAWNAAAARMFGYTERESIGQPITMIIPPDLHQEERDILRRLRAGERVEHYETVRVTKAGERIDVSLTISPLQDRAGRIVGCSTIARDITKAKQAEAALRQSERRLAREVTRAKTLQSISTRLISESTPEALYAQILGAAIELMASAAASVQMLAADGASLSLLAWKNFHPDSAAFWQRVEVGAGSTCSQALSDNERVVVADIEACGFMAGTQDQQEYRRSGIRAVQSTPLRSRSGRPLGMISTHWGMPHNPTEEDFRFFDVLARQAADLIERILAEEALRESEERFRVIANTAPVMIWMSDAERHVTYLNQTWLDYTGWPLTAALGQRWIEILHPDDAERCRDLYEKAFERRAPYQVEYRLRRHDGEYRWVVTVGVPRHNVDGSFAGYIGTAVDIGERKLAEEALSTVSQKLIEAHEEERTRIARELHDDINQRLAVVGMHLAALKRSPRAPASDFEHEIAGTYRQIVDAATAIQALARGLHPPKLDLLGLEAAVAGLCEEFSRRGDLTIDVQFENVPNALPPEISLCLYRVLQEALHNVVKHGRSPRAHVSLDGHINTIKLTVKDSGAGFDLHETLRGPGLGLTSMKERLKVVGGQLSIHSEPGRGTMIHAIAPLRLPAR
jgi:PAS domain S-box-containing protein